MKHFCRRACLLALLIAVILIPSACSSAVVTDPVAELLDYLTQRQYARIYKLLDPATTNGMTLADLTDRYEDVYTVMGVEEIQAEVLQSVELDSTTRRYTVMFYYATTKLGELNMGNEITIRWRNDRWYVVWSPSLLLPGLEEGDKLQLNNVTAQRGEIFDVNGEVLASNSYGAAVYTTNKDITDPDTMARLVAPLLGVTETEVLKKIDPDRFLELTEEEKAQKELDDRNAEGDEEATRTIILKTYGISGLSQELEEQLTAIEGIKVDRESLNPIRYYPYGTLLSHTLGYVSVITAEDLEKEQYAGLSNGTYIGRAGLESAYDEILRGESGYEMAVYAKDGTKKQIIASKAATDGCDLRLTIDVQYQMTAELLLQQNLTKEMNGCVIILDPQKGAVDAIASAPTYDANIFIEGVTDEEWAAFMDEANQQPLFNRATIGQYPPGSTFKPFVACYGLISGAITLDFAFDQSQIDHNTWKPDTDQWVYPAIRRVSATKDPMNLYNSIVNSDNIYFAYTAMQIGDVAFIDFAKSLGFGESFDFDLPVARSRISNTGSFSSIKILADSGYGQGELLVSPIQMASTFASLSNGGKVMRPYIVDTIRRMENKSYVVVAETQSQVLREVLTPETIETIQPMLRGVVTDGTAKAINIDGMEVHGKTGTAQIGADNSREIAWIIGYNTLGNEQKLVCVMVEVPADQGDVRNAIAKEIFKLVKKRGNS